MNDENIVPIVVARQCGGWLATSPRGSRFMIGVTADTEDQVRADFDRSIAGWSAMFEQAQVLNAAADEHEQTALRLRASAAALLPEVKQ
jgi:hypothetical protein